MNSFFKLIFFSFFILFLTKCARTGRPEGGPKDENAPLFVASNPPYKSKNFDKKEVKLEFNEFIKLKDLNKQLVVSPPLKTPLVISPQGSASKVLKIKILDTLAENTTYIFNFGSAIEDNNESNKLESFKYVFSTGNYIDSLTSSGNIKDAYLKETPKNINVLLYKIDTSFADSIVFKTKPNYVTNTLDSTNFKFTNLKEGKYLLVALKESSNDYLFNPKTDKIAFYTDTVVLPRDSIIKKPLRLFKEKEDYILRRGKEVTKGKIIFGYQGIAKNIKVKVLSDVPEDFISISKFEQGRDTLNYWHTPVELDSLNFEVSNLDFIDTLTVRLRKKNIDSLQIKSSISGVLHLRDTFYLKTNNPIVKIDTTKFLLVDKDTLAINFKTIISDKENKVALIFDKKPEQSYKMTVLPGAIYDIYNIENDSLRYSFKTKELEDYGRITLKIENPDNYNVIIELLEDKKDKVLINRNFIKKSETILYDLLEPKKYTIRAIIDSNNNNEWDTGNYLLNQVPETIIYFSKALELRANYYLNETFTIKK